ncbi:MAG: purine-nucleoside phosphorylase [Oscillospiraceae bacterium]|nr:purine-nucleoside phosphorylase [Oscillospiraceae bacterium]
MAAPTIHNKALPGQIAPTVLMPGDPLRATYIAEKYLSDVQCVSNVRGIPVYTGLYKGKRVSVMASGMGTGSMGIYSHELYHDYEVERIIRVGTAGGLHPDLELRDMVLGLSSSTDSGFATQFQLPGTFNPCCSFALAKAAWDKGQEMGLSLKAGMLFSGCAFHYSEDFLQKWVRMGALAVEMESAALYMNAMEAGKEALALCTVTDMVFDGRHCSVEERQTSLDQMLTLALEVAIG